MVMAALSENERKKTTEGAARATISTTDEPHDF